MHTFFLRLALLATITAAVSADGETDPIADLDRLVESTSESEMPVYHIPQRFLGVVVGSELFAATDGDLIDPDASSPVTPILMYGDRDLLGRSITLDVMTAGIFWQLRLGTRDLWGTGVALGVAGEALIADFGTRAFYDASGRAVPRWESEFSSYAGSLHLDSALGPGVVATSYEVRREVYSATSDTADGFVLPDDVRHRVDMTATLDLTNPIALGAAYDGFSLTVGGAVTTFAGFSTWGTTDFSHSAPSGPTITAEASAAYGRRIGRISNVSLEIAAFGGFNYYTRTLHALGSPGVMAGSALYVRGYPADSVEAERGALAHVDLGREVLPEKLHLSLFSDTALVDVPDRLRESTAVLHAVGAHMSARFPWSMQLKVTYAHSVVSLDGDTDGGRHALTLLLTRFAHF